jgi:peptidoglycan hydrolase-like protein with peptidoglycan-binding domain
MLLKPGQSGEAVKMLQRGLNNLGSILLVDGDFGPATRDAVLDARVVLDMPGGAEADDALQEAVASVPDPFLPLSAAGVTFIARAEVSGPRKYRRKYQNPLWPSLESGITIGIGYDLQFVNDDQLRMDWGDHVSLAVITLLSQVLGQRGSADRLASVSTVEIPLPAAMSVFMLRTLPRYLVHTRSIYPQVDELQPPRRTSLVSLVYNRGTRLSDRDPSREDRREMRIIRGLLAAADFEAVADQFESMARLWDLSGLVKRRQDEAKLWRSGFAALQLI